MSSRLSRLAALARELHQRPSLERALQTIVDGAARLLGVERTSVRLFDPTRSKLVAICRHGEPLHANPNVEFRHGEGLIGWIAEHVEPVRTGQGDEDPRYQARDDVHEGLKSFLGVPIVAGEACLGVLSATHDTVDRFSQEDEEVLALLAAIAGPFIEIARLERLSQVDRLTGALNRRGLDEVLPGDEAPPPTDDDLAVVMVDIDHFKKVNDTYGHGVGDVVLKELTGRLGNTVRAGDAVVRYGGEEFLLLLPGIGLANATRIAERARRIVAETPFRVDDTDIAVTISAGVAERRDGEAREALLERADEALYAAKDAGRNRVIVAKQT